MIELLRVGAFDNWAVALGKIKSAFEVDPKYSSLKLLSMHGGMGSLNALCSTGRANHSFLKILN